MALPVINEDFKFSQVKLPSGKTIGVRGWRVKDEKELLFTLETEENVEENKMNHIVSFLRTCVDDKSKFDTLSENDIKKITIEVRKLSKGEEVSYNYQCPNCKIRLEDVLVLTSSQTIRETNLTPSKINETLIVTFKDVSFNKFQDIFKRFNESYTKFSFYYVANSIESVTFNGTTYTEFTEEEMVDFLDQLNPIDMEKIYKEFSEKSSLMSINRHIKCHKCGEEIDVEFGDTISFLVL